MKEIQVCILFIFQKALVNHKPMVNCEYRLTEHGRLWEMSHEDSAVP